MFLGGQHTPFLGGQHAPFSGGHFNPFLGGQHERFFQHDQAFEELISTIIHQYKDIENDSPYKVSKFYKENWKWNYANLFKYFAKIIGCRLNENGFSDKTENLSRFIMGEIENTFIALTFEAKQGTKLILDASRTNEFSQTSFNGESCQFLTEDYQEFFHGWTSDNWFTIHWVYSVEKTFDKKKIYSANNYIKFNCYESDF